MKKIIDGAKYDTETAKCLGSDSYNGSSNDFQWWSESLYRTKSGKYFLHGEGGPMSRYSQSAGNNNWSGGSRIEPINRSMAEEWAEGHLSGDEYEEIFGEVDEGGEKEALNLLLPASTKTKLWELAENRKTTIGALVEEIINEKLKE